jgi:GNAT superfamily N-acetyltransferase
VDETELEKRRAQMGKSCLSFIANSPGSTGDQGVGWWVALSGAPSPDLNAALVDTGEEATAARTLRRVEEAGFPTLFMLAGAGRGFDLGENWQHVGEMPFMSSSLGSGQLRPDDRVRRAGAADFAAFVELCAATFGLAPQVAAVITETLDAKDDATKIWLLVEGGQAVSTVLTSLVDDAVCVWCMATPERFARRGHGRALLADVLSRARADGAGIGLLGATPAGKPLYDATGWSTLEDWRIYTNAASAQFTG